ncbi:hypothetical protein DCS_01782 [Drechmeria coniospora]|uniref:Uncharacterized protein n=1 Tax=Drechmeria coniospora TaxID=98403 RepID=A0A151GU51_DRECN|nr:hypothetical protein DCS_01782 [Drechmeria coniospora]KYK60644.1 hypothetical protein DCS_01782 [Drechmeria coniospora]
MAPETRSRGAPPSSRVYHSTPSLQQVQFPSRRKKVRTYGRQPRDHLATVTLRQQTLTQIDFVSSFETDEDDDGVVSLTESEAETARYRGEKERRNPQVDGGELDQQEEDADEDSFHVKIRRRRRPEAAPERKRKRRRTLGDETNDKNAGKPNVGEGKEKEWRRRTMGDHSAHPSSSIYHTQTLTQLLGHRSVIADSDDELDIDIDPDIDLGAVSEKDDDEDGFLHWLGDSGSPSVRNNQVDNVESPPSREESVIPQTPAKRTTTLRFDLPPSGGLGSPSTLRVDRYGPADKQHSPRPRRITSSPVESSVALTGVPRPREPVALARPVPALAIQDSFATTASLGTTDARKSPSSSTPVTPSGMPHPQPEENLEPTRPPASPMASSPTRTRTSPKKLTANGRSEIPDSDDDDFDFVRDDDDEANDGDFAGAETQLVLSELASTKDIDQAAPRLSALPPSSLRLEVVDSAPTAPSPLLPELPPLPPPNAHSYPPKPIRQPLHNPLSPHNPSQPFESQRVALSILQSLPPHTPRSDIILPLSPSQLDVLVTGHAVHVQLPFKIPLQVVRFWLLDDIARQLRYMACIDYSAAHLTRPLAPFSYPLAQIYELNNPVDEEDMRDEGWLHGPIAKYVYLPPAVIGQLLWNLRHELFAADDDKEDAAEDDNQVVPDGPSRETLCLPLAGTPSGTMTISQEVTAQIRSDIAHSTQFIPSTADQTRHDDEGASTPSRPRSSPATKPPRQSSSLDRAPQEHANLSFSQATTASRSPTPESPQLCPTRREPPVAAAAAPSQQTPQLHNSGSSLAFLDQSASLLTIPPGSSSLPASQLLTKSQLLSDSLTRDVNPPELPRVIWDSEDDDAPP